LNGFFFLEVFFDNPQVSGWVDRDTADRAGKPGEFAHLRARRCELVDRVAGRADHVYISFGDAGGVIHCDRARFADGELAQIASCRVELLDPIVASIDDVHIAAGCVDRHS
jgi:hypothetical protein